MEIIWDEDCVNWREDVCWTLCDALTVSIFAMDFSTTYIPRYSAYDCGGGLTSPLGVSNYSPEEGLVALPPFRFLGVSFLR